MEPETDETVYLNRPRLGGRSRLERRRWPYAAGTLVVLALAVGSGSWWALRPPEQSGTVAPVAVALTRSVLAPNAPAAIVPPAPPAPHIQQAFAPAPPPPAPPPTPAPAPAPYAPPLASEADILADQPDQLAVYRFTQNVDVVVLQFPSLFHQAKMLNRIAALVEKDGFPHDRVLGHSELDSRIRAEGGTPETFYYGHDYRAADINRFFGLATELNGDEQYLLDLTARLGWQERSAAGALVTLVRQTPDQALDPAARATILRHELSHGIYFTSPAYVEFCYRFWNDILTAAERAEFTAYLAKEGYDPALTDLIINETQAYLIHTHDPRYFRATDVGLSAARADELRRVFIAGMPPGWLRDAAAAAP